MNLAPDVRPGTRYTDEERAIIAGYLLQMRAGILKAVASSKRGAAMELDIGQEKQLVYWQMIETGNRWELYWIGYQVFRNKMYYGEPETINP